MIQVFFAPVLLTKGINGSTFRKLKMIETPRLKINPLSLDDLKRYAEQGEKLPGEDSLMQPHLPGDEEVSEIILNDILPGIAGNESIQLFKTIWLITDRQLGTVVGEFRFHGDPDKNRAVEIGYRTHKKHQGNGYMTEAIEGMIRWIENHQEITSIFAETSQTNFASQVVLRKNNFRIHHETGDMITFKADIFSKFSSSSGLTRRIPQP